MLHYMIYVMLIHMDLYILKNIQSFLIGFLTCFTEVSTDPWSTVTYVVLCLPLPYTCSSMLTWRETAWTNICSVRYCGLKLITFYLTEYSYMYLILDVWTRWILNMIRNYEWYNIHTLLELQHWPKFLFCYYSFNIIRHIFTRITIFCLPTQLVMWKVKRKKNPSEWRKIGFRMTCIFVYVFLSSFNVKFYDILLTSWHSVEAFSVISSTIEFENQLITKN